MPLKSGKSPSVFKSNVREMVNSSTFAKGKPEKKRIEMALAAAYAKKRKPTLFK